MAATRHYDRGRAEELIDQSQFNPSSNKPALTVGQLQQVQKRLRQVIAASEQHPLDVLAIPCTKNQLDRVWQHLKLGLRWKLPQKLDELRLLIRARIDQMSQAVIAAIGSRGSILKALSVADI